MATNSSFFDSFNEENYDDQDNRDSSDAEFDQEPRNDEFGNSSDEEVSAAARYRLQFALAWS